MTERMTVAEFINSIPNLADDDQPEPELVYRVWAEGHNRVWFAVSRTFDTEQDAEVWALRLCLTHRVEAEDVT